MKIVGIICGVVLILLVALSAVQGKRLDKMKEWERNSAAVQAGQRQAELDSHNLSQTIAAASRETDSSEKSLLAILADEQVNRLATSYLGQSFVMARRELVGRLETARRLQAKQGERFSKSKFEQTELGKKIRELEKKKQQLSRMTLHASRASTVEWRIQLEDIDDQLYRLRNLELSRRYEKEQTADAIANANVQNEKGVHDLVLTYEAATIRRLMTAIATQASALRQAHADAQRVREWVEKLDFWPVSHLAPFFQRH